MKFSTAWLLIASIVFISCSSSKGSINPDKPVLAEVKPPSLWDSLPVSEINIPIQINLKPIYSMAEGKVDTMYTSDGYPDGWVQEGCDTRYKYVFRRGPLQMKAAGTSLNLGFTGYYKIIGSTRVCVAGAAVSPWTPPCRCGFDEPERRVNVSFTNSLNIQPDYKVKLTIKRNEPQAVDKCTVCFWGQNITNEVLKGLKSQLDAAKADLDKNYGTVDLKPQFRQLWSMLGTPYNIYDMGWLQINPQRVHINNIYAKGDSLYVYLGLTARPVITSGKREVKSDMPNMGSSSLRKGFSIYVDAEMDYDSLSTLLNRHMVGKEFDLNQGSIKKKFIVKDCQLSGTDNEKLIIKMKFGGTNSGTVYLTGKPVYTRETNVLELKDIEFDLKSRNALLSVADLFFNKRIIGEISKYARYDLKAYIDSAKVGINQQLNHEWVKGISSTGSITDIRLIGVFAGKEALRIRSNCTGNLSVNVESVDFTL